MKRFSVYLTHHAKIESHCMDIFRHFSIFKMWNCGGAFKTARAYQLTRFFNLLLVTGAPDGLKSVLLSVSYLIILEYPIHFLKNMDHTLFNCIIPRRLDYLVSQLPKDWSSSGFVQLNVSHKQIMFRIDERPYNLVGINSADLLLLSFYNPLLLWSSIIVLRQKPEPLTRGLCVYIIYQYKKG